jgi:hypothetical protein
MICWFENLNNTVQAIQFQVYFMSSKSSQAHGYYLDERSFRQNIAIYIARGRDVIITTWGNQSDVYLAPKDKDNDK